jgi:hypothetical protein
MKLPGLVPGIFISRAFIRFALFWKTPSKDRDNSGL